MFRPILAYFELHKHIGLALGYFLVFIIGFLDYFTGYRLGFSIFYLIPISLVVWHTGLRNGIVIAVIATIVWLLADAAARGDSRNLLIITWNALVRMGFFMTVVVALAQLRMSLDRESKLARTDFLTGIANNQFFMETLSHELQRCRRYRHPVTLVYFDCDEFKAVNDRFGHDMGNKLLREVASTTVRCVRTIDKVGRLGGDEFLILLPETDSEKAKITVGRVQQGLMNAMAANKWNVTFSVGVATFMVPPDMEREAISHADRLMYCAKSEGKNRIVYQTFSEKIVS